MARQPSARAHAVVLDAALRLLIERGIDATSMDAIAEASGVSKATIYKHWADKDALCLDALGHAVPPDSPPADAASGSLRADLLAALGAGGRERHSSVRQRLMAQLLAYAARHPAFARAWRAKLADPPRSRLREALERGMIRGDLPPTLDVDLAIAMLQGPLVYCGMLSLVKYPAPSRLLEGVVDAFLKSSGADVNRPAETPRRRTRRRGLPRTIEAAPARTID